MQSITIKGDNLEIVKTNGLSAKPQVAEKWLTNGLSAELIEIDGIQYHRWRALEQLLDKMAGGDRFDQQVAKNFPRLVLVATEGIEYNEETKYQIHRNQQANFIQGTRICKAYRFGDLYENTKTGETTRERKGANPFDDWEFIHHPTGGLIKEAGVLCAGNNFQIYMPPWSVNVPEDVTPRFNRALDKAIAKTEYYLTREAEILRILDGNANPISDPR